MASKIDLEYISDLATNISKSARKLSRYNIRNLRLGNVLAEWEEFKKDCEQIMFDANKIWRHTQDNKETTDENPTGK